jgi:uncharacterized protein (TIGR01777 family)
MRVAITGATGFVGRALVEALLGRGDEVLAFTRDPERASDQLDPEVALARWDTADPAGMAPHLAGRDAVVNLAGEPIFGKRWNETQKARIRASRVEGTRALVEAIRHAEPRPSTLVSGSAVGYYGGTGSQELAEDAPSGADFLATVCRDWEREALRARDAGLRTVILRIGVVLGSGGGALPRMLTPFKLFVGGPVGSGTQWFSWIHAADLVRLVLFALDHPQVRGVLNATAPTPVTNREFSDTLGHVLGRPAWLPAPAFGLRAALGEVASILLEGQRVVPHRALEAGFAFEHPEPEAALRAILGK